MTASQFSCRIQVLLRVSKIGLKFDRQSGNLAAQGITTPIRLCFRSPDHILPAKASTALVPFFYTRRDVTLFDQFRGKSLFCLIDMFFCHGFQLKHFWLSLTFDVSVQDSFR